MANITLAIDDETLRKSREYARKQGVSLNALIRDLLVRTVERPQTNGAEEFIRLAAAARGNSGGQRWKREDLYDR